MSIEAIKKALEGVTPDRVERLWWFLHILSKSSGSTNADDDKWNWINAFCSDYEDDTFNRAEKLGFIDVSHDSFMETSKAGMTPAGFSFINYFEKAPSFSLISEIDRLQRENTELKAERDEALDDAKFAERIAAKREFDAAARAEAAEAEVKRLQTELALSKPLYSGRQIEARVKLLEEALKPFADLAPSYDPPEDDDDHKCWHAESTPTLGDLRRARNTLASTGGDHHAE